MSNTSLNPNCIDTHAIADMYRARLHHHHGIKDDNCCLQATYQKEFRTISVGANRLDETAWYLWSLEEASKDPSASLIICPDKSFGNYLKQTYREKHPGRALPFIHFGEFKAPEKNVVARNIIGQEVILKTVVVLCAAYYTHVTVQPGTKEWYGNMTKITDADTVFWMVR